MLGMGSGRREGRQDSILSPKALTEMSASGAIAGQGATPTCLVRMVEGEIIPRLLLAHRQHAQPSETSAAAAMQQVPKQQISKLRVDAAQFAAQALDQEAYALLACVEGQLALGIDVETLFLDLVAPAARQLGVWWEEDACDFVDVTMGLWRLQEVVHEISARIPGAAEGKWGERRAFFAAPPGSQHGFGALMVEEFFRRSGWSTWSAQNASRQEQIREVTNRWFDIIGLTVSTENDLAELPAFIAALRAASRNPDVSIMVGGWVFNQNPDLVSRMGADCTAPDARAAVEMAESLIEARSAKAFHPVGRM